MDEVVEFTGSFGVGNHVNPHRNRDIREQVKRTMDGEWMKKSMVKRTFRCVVSLKSYSFSLHVGLTGTRTDECHFSILQPSRIRQGKTSKRSVREHEIVLL